MDEQFFCKKCYVDSNQGNADTEIIAEQVAPCIENEIPDLITPPSIDEDDPLHFTSPIPNLCGTIDRLSAVEKCLKYVTQTKVSGNKHKACVCAVCDSFIIGVEDICWLAEEAILGKKEYLSVKFLEQIVGRRMPSALRQQYLLDIPAYSDLLLSPRAHQENGKLMSCLPCYNNVMNKILVKPPRYAISNGWAIGQLPSSFDAENIEEVLAV